MSLPKAVCFSLMVGMCGLLVAAGASAQSPARAPAAGTSSAEREARAFLQGFTALSRPVSTVAAEAAWKAATDVTPAHVGERAGAEKAAAAILGAKFVIEQARALLKREKQLRPETALMLRKVLLAAAESPATIPDVVSRRIEAEVRQSSLLDGYTFCLEAAPVSSSATCAQPITANQIDRTLRTSGDLAQRARVWTASKEVGRVLKPGLQELIRLRNQIAREMGHSSFFALQVADYGMSAKEMMSLLAGTLQAIEPLYEGLACWARHTLASRYKQPVPKSLPAHWLGNRWAQSWPGLVDGQSLDPLLAGRSPQSVVKAAEDFYVSLGFARLPDSFWSRSDLYPVPPGSPRKKNAHASAWHIDGESDTRSLMSVEANQQWFGTAHHELGHIYYYLAYARPQVPPLLRTGANRAFHEAVGELGRLASMQAPYLRRLGLAAAVAPAATGGQDGLLAAALDSIVFLRFAAGTMTHFEHDLYEAALPSAQWQARWWELAARFQQVVPPSPRPPELCDACTKTHMNDDPAQYYDYALATLIKFQLHDHICRKLLKQPVQACDYAATPQAGQQVGEFLRGILSLGATRDWRQVMQEKTGAPLGPRALLDYFAPLAPELARRNQGQCQ